MTFSSRGGFVQPDQIRRVEMKLSFRKSGGFAPIFQGFEFDSEADLADADRAKIMALIEESGIMSETSKRVQAARDVFLYSFEIESEGQKKRVIFDQLSVPAKVKPLLDFLLGRSKIMPPD
jgi:hypothetical protein